MGPVKASPQTQLRLLELADLDAELARLDHRRRGLPEVAELARLEARASELKDALVVNETELGDLTREQSRAERDVEQVRTRIEKDRARLDAGQVSAARELASLQARAHPRDGRVMIGTLHIHRGVGAAKELGEVVRHVGHEVRERAVGLAHHAVLVVAKIGGAQP